MLGLPMDPSPDPSLHSSARPLLAAWLGWAFDGLDGYLYIMIAREIVTQLVANEHGISPAAAQSTLSSEIGWKAAVIQAVFLLGWAVGGAVFGRLGDRLGRSRTLTFTILTYAIFTGLGFFATAWWHLLIFRFLAALGIGGEWAAGSSLVAETLPKRHRDWASALLQTGYITGCIAAALSYKVITDNFGVRSVFLVGVLPAFVTLWIRHSVPEPAVWKRACEGMKPPAIRDLFAPGIARITILLLIHISIALTVVWAFLFFAPQMVLKIPEVKDWTPEQLSLLKMKVTVAYLSANIVANFLATYLRRWLGARYAFALLMSAAFICLFLGFRSQPTLSTVYLVTIGFACTGLGMFAIFPLYVPPLFPTLLRTLGAGVTYNVGRVAAAIGTLVAGSLSTLAGGPAQAVFWIGLLYIPGIVVCLMLPTKDHAETYAETT